MPRSRWKVRKANAPGTVTANRAATPAPVAAAEAQAARRRTPRSSIAGHTFSSAPNPASAPISRGCRTPASSAATATAVTITS
ncbi:hypothetical protein SGRIM128S_09039 [Streptomyces griseomycini]